MPFPWKKVKSTRISQLVNDHLHKSQKRRDGSSLVVATGFPTSLIDLIIKNREKLKTQSKRKRQNAPISDADYPTIAESPLSFSSHLPAAPPPSIAGSPAPSHTPLRCPSPLHNLSVLPSPSQPSCVNEIPIVPSSGDERGADINRVLLGVLKMFLVVVLAMGTQRLTVGITLSAFLLLFLEYVGKHANLFSKPIAEAKMVLSPIVRSVSRLLRFKEVRLDEKKGGILMNPGSSSLKSFGYPDQEIQVVEPKACTEEIQPVIEECCLGYQEIELMEKEELLCDAAADCKRKSRGAKIKSKMKKLVPKKFKSSRKENALQRLETVKDDSIISNEEQFDRCEHDGNYEHEIASELSSISVARLSEVIEEANTKEEEKVRGFEAALNWRHVVLCLTVLIGLIGGRAFALVLTLSWFLLLKLGEMVHRYMNEVPMIKSYNDKSCS